MWGNVADIGETGLSSGGRCLMFLGTYTPKLDDKGRLTLPAKFRDQVIAQAQAL